MRSATAAVALLHVLPATVFLFIALRALRVFTPDSGGRDPRSYLIVLSFWGMVLATARLEPAPVGIVIAGVAGLAASLALFEWTARSVSGRRFSYIFETDVPGFLHTAGPYAWIRNPFYASYLLALGSSAALFPGILPGAIVVMMAVYFNFAARFEERKFEASALSDAYARYRRRTGRFLPRGGAIRRRP